MYENEEDMVLDEKYSDLFYMAVEFMRKFCEAAIDMGSEDAETDRIAATFDSDTPLGAMHIALLRQIPADRMMRGVHAKVHAVIAAGHMPEHGMAMTDVFSAYDKLGEGKA